MRIPITIGVYAIAFFSYWASCFPPHAIRGMGVHITINVEDRQKVKVKFGQRF